MTGVWEVPGESAWVAQTKPSITVREVFRAAVAINAMEWCSCTTLHRVKRMPQRDRRMTQRLAKAAEILQIKFVDEIVVASGIGFSFREAGLL